MENQYNFMGSYSVDISGGAVKLPKQFLRELYRNQSLHEIMAFLLRDYRKNYVCLLPLNSPEPIASSLHSLQDRIPSGYPNEERLSIDADGLVRLPHDFIDMARLDLKTTMIGALHYIEVWNPKHFNVVRKRIPLERIIKKLGIRA